MHGFNPRVGKISWSRKCQLVPVFLPGKFHGQRSLVGYSPWGCKDLDTTSWAYAHARMCMRARAHTHTHTHVFGTPVRGSIGLSMATENVMMNKS